MKKAIFFDVDGTLIDCTIGITDISPKVKESIRKLQECGNYVFIASGRPYAFLNKHLLDFGFDGFVLMNGSQVIFNEKSVYNDPIDKDTVRKIVENFEKLDIEYILEGDHYSYMKSDFNNLIDFQNDFNIPRDLICTDFNIDDVDVYKIEMVAKNKQADDYCLSLKDNSFNLIGYNTYNASNLYPFELYTTKNSKASGIYKVLDHLDIDVSNSYAFGDGANDIEMLQSVGLGIAMGNADDYVKGHAKKVTDTVANDGIAVGIEKYIL